MLPHDDVTSASPGILLDLTPAGGRHGERGIGRYVRGLAMAIADLEPELRDRIGAFGPPSDAISEFAHSVVSTGGGPRSRLPAWIEGWMATRRALRITGARILHATDPHRPLVPPVRSIVTAYDLIPLHEPQLLASLRPDHRWAYRRYCEQLRTADRVVAISQTTAADLTRTLGAAEDRIEVVYPYVSPPMGGRQKPLVEPTFIVVGALDVHKRPELALEGFARFHQRHKAGRLRFIGPASDERVAALRSQIARLGLAETVSIEGRLPDVALEEAYQSATALVTASRIEGFGLPPVEAVLRGTPVIAVETEAAIETVGDAAILVPPDAEAIGEAMASPRAIPTVTSGAIARRFSREAVALALGSVYRHVAE